MESAEAAKSGLDNTLFDLAGTGSRRPKAQTHMFCCGSATS